MILLFLVVVIGYGLYVLSPAERKKLLQTILAALRNLPETLRQIRNRVDKSTPESDAFSTALLERTPRALTTLAILALNAGVFVFMLVSPGSFGDPDTLIRWGANFAPRTTNAEWWRLVTMMFVHTSLVHLLINMAGLAQVGMIIERLVGSLAFAVVYLAAGILASLVTLSEHPMAVTVGPSGAIFGIYGLLLATMIWGLLYRSPLTIPVQSFKLLAPAMGIFVLYNAASGSLDGSAEIAGLAAGFICGIVLASGVSERTPSTSRVAGAMVATVVIAVASAVPLRGVADVRPEIARLVSVEESTAKTYEVMIPKFRNGQASTEALALVIDKKIMPELQSARARLKAIDGVPAEHKALIDGAMEYLRLREASWRIRTEGLHKKNQVTLREAERTERAALEALEPLKSVGQK
jgi:rhomboid protease GluP